MADDTKYFSRFDIRCTVLLIFNHINNSMEKQINKANAAFDRVFQTKMKCLILFLAQGVALAFLRVL